MIKDAILTDPAYLRDLAAGLARRAARAEELRDELAAVRRDLERNGAPQAPGWRAVEAGLHATMRELAAAAAEMGWLARETRLHAERVERGERDGVHHAPCGQGIVTQDERRTASSVCQVGRVGLQIAEVRVGPLTFRLPTVHFSSDSRSGRPRKKTRPTSKPQGADAYKGHLSSRDLDAARREAKGEVVARKPSGKPYDHVREVENAQAGLVKLIQRLKRKLGHPRLSEAELDLTQKRLGEASRLLDRSEEYLPR